MKGTPFSFIKSGIYNGKGLELGAEHPVQTLLSTHPPPCPPRWGRK